MQFAHLCHRARKVISQWRFISGLGFWLTGIHLFSQCPESNKEVFIQMVLDSLPKFKGAYKEVTGLSDAAEMFHVSTDTGATQILMISEPVIRFKKSGKKKYVRSISGEISVIGENPVSQPLLHLDTVIQSCMKTARLAKEKEFRGEIETPLSVILLPAIFILAGIGVILSLFYIRS